MERIRLDIIPKGLMPVCHASQYDAGRVIRLDLMDGLQGYSLTDEEIELNVRKPDGHIVTASVDVVEGQTYVDIVTTEQMCAVEGENICELKISKDDAEIYSLNFRMMVEKSVTEGGDPSESFVYNLHTQIAEGVAEEVATQYDSANVIFDEEPTENHGIGYTVTSEGIKTAIDNAFDYDNTASGSIVHIEDGADNIPVKSLVSEIVAVESGSGEKSPDNPYTISGFDSGIIGVYGTKNLFGGSLNGTLFPTKVLSGTQLTASMKSNSGASFRLNLYRANQTLIDFWGVSESTGYQRTFTATEDIFYFAITNVNGTVEEVQIEKRSSKTAYEPYNGNTYTFAFGQTVFGGYFDNKGNLVVTHKIVDFADLGYYYSNSRFSSTDIPDVKNVSVWNSALKLCSCYDIAEVQTWTQGDFIIGLYGKNIYVKDSRYTDTASFKQALTGQKFVVELANPIPLSITSQDIPTLLGENNIFSNCGDVEVEYYTSKSNDILEFVDSEIGKKNGTNIPIEENSQDSIKDYVDDEVSTINTSLSNKADSDSVYSKAEVDTALSGKLDTTAIKTLTGTGTTDASGIITSTALGIAQLNYNQHLILGIQSSTDGCVVNVGQYNTNFYYVCSNASNISVPMANTSVTVTIVYMDR